MSSIQISVTDTKIMAMGRLIIPEKCALCTRVQKSEESCIRNEKTGRIICKSCIKAMSYIDLRTITTNPDQCELNFK